MSLDSLKDFLNKSGRYGEDLDKNAMIQMGDVDPYNTFTFKFKKPTSNIESYSGLASLEERDLHPYIKQLTLPNASINGEQINIPGIQFATHRLMPMGDSGSVLRVEFLNTQNPIIENTIFKWMKDCTLNASKFPISYKSTIEIGFTHSSKSGESDKNKFASYVDQYKYMYYGVRPVEMATYNPSNEPMTEFYRNVSFAYDYFWITK